MEHPRPRPRAMVLDVKLLQHLQGVDTITHYQCLRVRHNCSFLDEFLLTLALETGDMCHNTIDSLVILLMKSET